MTFFSIHHHARYSVMDGMGKTEHHVRRAKELGYPALALTDHGTMAGAAELYQACRAEGIKPMPGIEAYAAYGTKDRRTFHVGMVATTEQGYLNLVQINNRMMRDRYYKPILDLTALSDLSTEGVVMTTGCHFGVLQSAWRADRTAALNVVAVLAEHFEVFVEAQAHGIVGEHGEDQDLENQEAALLVAKTLGLPMVVGNDCHYIEQHHRKYHDTMKRLGSWSDDPDSAVFPGKYGYHMPHEDEAQAWYLPEAWERGLDGLAQIARRTVVLPPLERFDPVLVQSPDDDVRIGARVMRFVDGMPDAYRRRAEEELEVIGEFGFAGYLRLVAEITDHMREQGILYGIRGSAGGSLVCWALGITDMDPLHWDLMFDRFLSRDRAKLPDVDIDVDSERRAEVIQHLRERYVVQSICSYSEMSAEYQEFSPWRASAEECDGQWKGSAIRKWETAQRKTGGTMVLDQHTGRLLRRMSADGRVIASRGTHAAGLVVAPDTESMKWLPLDVIGSSKDADRFVTAFDMDSVEAMGYVKMDLLGLKMLHAISVCERLLGIDTSKVPLDDKGVFAMIGEGITEGVFQLEGWTAKRGVQKMKPKHIGEVIDAMALFRPAVRDAGADDLYLRRMRAARRGRPTNWSKGLHADLREVLRPTYGVLLYQEQLIEALKKLGFEPDELGRALKAIKSSNKKSAKAKKEIRVLKHAIADLAATAGWSETDVHWLESAFTAYAGYGFNKAHATAYGLLAYRTAWLVHHYPGEYLQGLVTAHSGDADKVAQYTEVLKERLFTMMPVSVSESDVDIRIDVESKKIYPALTTIKGIGPAAAAAIARHKPYHYLADLLKLQGTAVTGLLGLARGLDPHDCSGHVKALAEAGALDDLIGRSGGIT